MQRYPHLFSPIRIGSMEVPNRICFAATSSELADTDGFVTDDMIEFYAERARGGTGLIIVETTYVAHEGKRLPRNPMLHEDRYIAGMKRLVEEAHAGGAKIAVQLNDGGREAVTAVTGAQPRGPSAIASHFTGGGSVSMPREMAAAEIGALVGQFADAAERAREAGFDGVELHGAHGYLISQFLSPLANHREDEYGGSVRGRARFFVELIQAIKYRLGDNYPVICRLNSDDCVPGGMPLADTLETVRYLEEAGADSISVSAGMHASRPYMIIPNMAVEHGWNRASGAAVRRHCNVPVMIAGRIHKPEMAEAIIENGEADMVGISRSLIADPWWPHKARIGRSAEIVPCIACNECVANIHGHHGIACTVNPFASKEHRLKEALAEVPPRRRIAIIGAGAAGLSVALVAARRGHEVHLFEQGERLGGQLNIAWLPPHRDAIRSILDYYRQEVHRLGVTTHLGKAPSIERLRELQPDSIIIAIGARSTRPEVKGGDKAHVLTGWKVLAGVEHPGNRVVVVGGGLVGIEVADHLAAQGKAVTLVARSGILKKAVHADRIHYEDRLKEEGIEALTDTDVLEVGDGWIDLRTPSRDRRIAPIDNVIFCTGYEDRMDDAAAYSLPGIEVEYVGDVRGSRKFFHAIEEGAMAALRIA